MSKLNTADTHSQSHHASKKTANKATLDHDLLNHYGIWCASELVESAAGSVSTKNKGKTEKASASSDTGQHSASGIDTGYAHFNQLLTEGGWPRQGVIEILYDRAGSGELSILIPLLQYFSQYERWLIWVAPPYQLHMPGVLQAGIDSNKILQVAPQSAQDCLWCTEQAVKSGAASLVLSWPGHVKSEHVRRLQILSSQYNVPCVLFRAQGSLNTPCALRIHISNIDQHSTCVHILKRRRGWSSAPFTLRLRTCPSYRYQHQASLRAPPQ